MSDSPSEKSPQGRAVEILTGRVRSSDGQSHPGNNFEVNASGELL
jgi:hypothetical protein